MIITELKPKLEVSHSKGTDEEKVIEHIKGGIKGGLEASFCYDYTLTIYFHTQAQKTAPVLVFLPIYNHYHR